MTDEDAIALMLERQINPIDLDAPATPELVWRAENAAWKLGCDGIPLPAWVTAPELLHSYAQGLQARTELGFEGGVKLH